MDKFTEELERLRVAVVELALNQEDLAVRPRRIKRQLASQSMNEAYIRLRNEAIARRRLFDRRIVFLGKGVSFNDVVRIISSSITYLVDILRISKR